MKKLFLIMAIAFNCIALAQDYKIIYEFKWKTEPHDSNYNYELTTLLNNGKDSYFEALSKFKYDSLKTDMRNKGFRNLPGPKEIWKFQSLIKKDLQNQIVRSENEIFDKVYVTKFESQPKWKIFEDKNKIFEYNVQKAETLFGGRKWVAWFTNEIPINDGPYKFFGLPGLILKITDSDENFIFEIKGLTKDKSDISKRNRNSSIINLTSKQWNAFWEKYQNDPSNIFQNLNEPGASYSYVYNGKNVNSKEAKESYNKAEKEKINLFKNPIELKPSE
ncbi:GLPGLI family protein [Cloacibacterium sp.]|uniref:GLPGLI family protein n=1 Tax=Cloacibacterium sp. TaxID=1913682 RepID=UPI0039E3D198